MKLKRCEKNPVLSPNPKNKWESLVTTNPAAWYDSAAGCFKMLYRAAGDDPEHRIYFGLAQSRDGVNWRRVFDQPVFSPGHDTLDAGCVEDPRVIKMGDDYLITYASRPFPPGQYWLKDDRKFKAPACPDYYPKMMQENATATFLVITRDFKTFFRAGCLTDPRYDDRDVILFPEKVGGRFVMMHRPMQWCGRGYPNEHPAIWISKADDLLGFRDSVLLAQAKFPWELKIGGNTPPIKTAAGWLTLYHAVGNDGYYRLGAMLLDLEDPAMVRYRTRDWLLQPEESYEKEGFYNGVVFPCGKVVCGDTLYVYYGGADKYVGLATCSLTELLDYLKTCPE